MTLEQYREEQLALFRQYMEQKEQALQARLRQDLQAYFQQQTEALQQDIQEKIDTAVQGFNAQMASVERMRADGMPQLLLESFEKSLRDQLQTTIAFYQKLFDQFVKQCEALLP